MTARRSGAIFLLMIVLVGLAKPAHSQDSKVPITIGPITLGAPLPTLDICPTTGWNNTKQSGICKDGDVVWNLPHHGASLMIWRIAVARVGGQAATIPTLEDETAIRAKDLAVFKMHSSLSDQLSQFGGHRTAEGEAERSVHELPVGKIYGEIWEQMCNGVLDKLKTKFGEPVTRSAERMNSSGARWTMTEYIWFQPSGDQIALTRHFELSNCWLDAETAGYKQATAEPGLKF